MDKYCDYTQSDITFHYYGTFAVRYNSVFGDHMEPISTVCWLFLQASIRNNIVKYSYFNITRYQILYDTSTLHELEYLMSFTIQLHNTKS